MKERLRNYETIGNACGEREECYANAGEKINGKEDKIIQRFIDKVFTITSIENVENVEKEKRR